MASYYVLDMHVPVTQYCYVTLYCTMDTSRSMFLPYNKLLIRCEYHLVGVASIGHVQVTALAYERSVWMNVCMYSSLVMTPLVDATSRRHPITLSDWAWWLYPITCYSFFLDKACPRTIYWPYSCENTPLDMYVSMLIYVSIQCIGATSRVFSVKISNRYSHLVNKRRQCNIKYTRKQGRGRGTMVE